MNLVTLIVYTFLSYGLASVVPRGDFLPEKAGWFAAMASKMDFLGDWVHPFLKGEGFLKDPVSWGVAFSVPVLIATATFIVLLRVLARGGAGLSAATPRQVFGWSAAFAVVCVFAMPVLAQDFWLSVGWGRMIVEGMNPYHMNLPREVLDGIPIGPYGGHQRMTYGPLWGAGSGALAWLSFGNGLLNALLLKLVLAGAWVGSLRLIWSLLRDQSVWRQCVGIAILGWLPLGVTQIMGDGHNDIVMIFFLLLWLRYHRDERPVWASLSLAASVMTKYVTAPLFLLDLLYMRFSRRRPWSEYLAPMAVAGVFMLVMVGLFFRSPEFFTATTEMQKWHLFTPMTASQALQRLSQVWFGPFTQAARWGFLALAGYFLIAYWRRPMARSFWTVVLAFTLAILFSVVHHIWPWYVLWGLALATLIPGHWLSQYITGVAIVAPFLIVPWNLLTGEVHGFYRFDVPTLAMYGIGLVWCSIVPFFLLPKSTNPTPSTLPVGR